MKHLSYLMMIAVGGFGYRSADAATYRGTAEGQVSEIVDASLTGIFSIGEPFRFSYVFDDEEVDSQHASFDVGLYSLRSAGATIGGFGATPSLVDDGIIMVVDAVPDRYEVIWHFADGFAGRSEVGVGFSLWDPSGDVFADDHLPVQVDMTDFEPHTFGVWTGQPNVLLRGELTSLTFEIIPEPATLGLLGVGLLCMFIKRAQ